LDDIPLSVLYGILFILILLSAFFSSSETGLMTLNRYRLKHLAKNKHKGALKATQLLEQPDRLIGLILIGNNTVNVLASSLTTIIAIRHGGEGYIPIAAGILILVILIFAEVAPKTLAATHPEKIAFPASWIYIPLLRLMYPIVLVINAISNLVLRMFGIRLDQESTLSLSREELRTVVNEAGAMIPRKHQKMLLNILDLEKATVEDIMIPRTDIIGIDLDDDKNDILNQLRHSQYTRLPVYRQSIDNTLGFIHLRKIARLLAKQEFSVDSILKTVRDTYFVPEGTPLNKQLIQFQAKRHRIGMVVDEYGDIQGLITLEDILEEIVGEFTTDPSSLGIGIHPQEDGSFLIDGSTHIRAINRMLNWHLPVDGPKTLNGLISEYLESIPESGISLLLAGYPVEIIQVQNNTVKTARMQSRLPRP
jgi:Mg2+/Co2+ transporter CorB